MIEIQKLKLDVEEGVRSGDLGSAIAYYCLYRVKANQALVGLSAQESWDTKGDIYRLGSLVQKETTRFISGGADTPETILEVIKSGLDQIPTLARQNRIDEQNLASVFQSTVCGGAGTAIAATVMRSFIPHAWECADADLDVGYSIDVVFEDGSRLQSKVNQPENYRSTDKLERRIFHDSASVIEIPTLKFTRGSYELHFSPLALIPYGDTLDLMHMLPNVLHAVSGEQTLTFYRPFQQKKYDYSHGLVEALLLAVEAIVDTESLHRHYQPWFELTGDTMADLLMESSSESDANSLFMRRLSILSGVLPDIDNFDILARTKQAPGLTAFSRDVTRAMLLSLKADMLGMFTRFHKTGKPIYYTETSLFDMDFKKRPQVVQYAVAAAQFIDAIKNVKGINFIELDPLDGRRFVPSEKLPVIRL